jgi:hypothetical protein
MLLWSAAVAAAFGLGGATLAAGTEPVADGGVVGVWPAGGCCANPPTECAKMIVAARPRAGLGRDQIANLIEQILHVWRRLTR